MDQPNQKPLEIHLVTTTDSPEFTHLTHSLTQTSLVGLDAEWKPVRTHQTSFPTVSLLQIACQLGNDSVVFLLDLLSIPLSSLWEPLKEMLISPDILKLGFRFKQDLVYLSSTFCSQGCNPGFDKVEPYLDITSVYNHLQYKKNGRNVSKQNKSLSTICGEMLGISLSKHLDLGNFCKVINFDVVYQQWIGPSGKKHELLKLVVEGSIPDSCVWRKSDWGENPFCVHIGHELLKLAIKGSIPDSCIWRMVQVELQCSDWSQRPLTEEQITYAAMDAHCLLGIFKVFQAKVAEEGELVLNELSIPSANLGLKELFRKHDMSDKVLSTQFCEALAIVQATTCSDVVQVTPSAAGVIKKSSCWVSKPMDEFLLKIVKKHGDRILLKESDRAPKTSKKKRKKQLPINGIPREKNLENFDEWQGTAPWDPLVGGDGYPKFLCDVMVSISI
ncbi:hypothetical protein TSUD_10560 [Trifolium subterraneum]|nr:hypothetical protein TSUD_10560 [Trifolium subterraneum]